MEKSDHTGNNELIMVDAVMAMGRHRVQLTNTLLARLDGNFKANGWIIECFASDNKFLGRDISWNFNKFRHCGASCIIVALYQLLILLVKAMQSVIAQFLEGF
jgi:hypothetical protein